MVPGHNEGLAIIALTHFPRLPQLPLNLVPLHPQLRTQKPPHSSHRPRSIQPLLPRLPNPPFHPAHILLPRLAFHLPQAIDVNQHRPSLRLGAWDTGADLNGMVFLRISMGHAFVKIELRFVGGGEGVDEAPDALPFPLPFPPCRRFCRRPRIRSRILRRGRSWYMRNHVRVAPLTNDPLPVREEGKRVKGRRGTAGCHLGSGEVGAVGEIEGWVLRGRHDLEGGEERLAGSIDETVRGSVVCLSVVRGKILRDAKEFKHYTAEQTILYYKIEEDLVSLCCPENLLSS